MFRLGAADVLTARRTVREFTAEPVAFQAVRRAIAAAITAPAPHHSQPWRFAVLESAAGQDPAAGRHAGRVARGPDGGRLHARADRQPGPARRAAAQGTADHRAVPGGRRGAHLSRCAPQRVGADHVRGRDGCGGGEPARRAGRRGPRLVLGIQHAVLPGGGTPGALGLPADWEPMGAIGVGHPAAPAADRPARDPDGFTMRL